MSGVSEIPCCAEGNVPQAHAYSSIYTGEGARRLVLRDIYGFSIYTTL